MKKVFLLLISLSFFCFYTTVNAACNNEELNAWAEKAEAKFTEATSINAQSLGYAYFLSIAPYREDLKIKVIDKNGNSAYAKNYNYSYYGTDKETGEMKLLNGSVFGVGCYNNLEEDKYKIEIYGGDNSACKNELLKTVVYTVPRYNRMIKYEMCEKYPDHELCQPYTNKTKNMSEKEFKSIMAEYEKSIEPKKERSLIVKLLLYSLYIIIPFVIVTTIYMVKIKNYKKSERRK